LSSDPKTGKDVLSFKPSQQIKKVVYELSWGTSLCDFHPTLTTANQISKVTVKGWDRKSGKPISASVSTQNLKINRDLVSVANVVEGREEVITGRPVYSQQEAKDLARGILTDQAYEMVKASGSTVGLPDLRAGARVVIKKLGPRFSGTYFVTDTTHTFGEGGYRTQFGARREGPEGASQ
jgi:phage protein D